MDSKEIWWKKTGELKSTCIGNVVEIVKIGKNLVNCCNLPSSPKFFTANNFYCLVNNYVFMAAY